MRTWIAFLSTVVITMVALAEGAPPVPVELGSVPWVRDVNAATTQSKASGKPMLVLFQEVPG